MLCSEWSPPTAATRKLLHLCVSTSMAVFKNYSYLFISSDKFLCYSPVVVRLYSFPQSSPQKRLQHWSFLPDTDYRQALLAALLSSVTTLFPKAVDDLSLSHQPGQKAAEHCNFMHPQQIHFSAWLAMYDPHANSIVVSDEKLYHFKADTQLSCSTFLFYIFGPAKTELKEMKDFWIYQITSLNY